LFTFKGDDEVDKLHLMFLQPTQNNAQEQDRTKGEKGEKNYG
jgi:hypothetical protein